MDFSKSELRLISRLNSKKDIREIAKDMQISQSQAYRIADKLHQKGIASLREGKLETEPKTHVSLLLRILAKAPNLSVPLSGTGIEIYLSLTKPKKVSEVEKETSLHKTTILKKIKEGRKMSLLAVKDKAYQVNERLWPDVVEFLLALSKYEESIDERVPAGSIIYHKNRNMIVFSTKEEVDAEKTAFSAYGKYGIKLLLTTNYYCLPRKQLDIHEIFMHALYVVQKSQDAKEFVFVALLFAKFRKELRHISHPVVEKLKKIFSGEKVSGNPTLTEIKEKMKIYDIEG